jgi:acetyl esterase/lipase
MAFEDLPLLPPLLHPGAEEYARRISARSRIAMSTTRCVLDQPYGDDYWQKVDIYLPPESCGPGPWPVLCYLHGGAWANGCKEWMGFMAPGLVDVPALFVSVSYRLAPAVRMPGIVADCADAIAWVHRHAARFGGDPGQLFIGGHSAGGHLSALLALRRDLLGSRGVPAEAIRAALPTSGSYDLRAQPDAARKQDHLLKRVLETPESGWEWSPVRWVEDNTTPFLVTWAESDFPHLATQGAAFVEALQKQTGRVEYLVVPGTGHFTVNEEAARPDSHWRRTVREWLTNPKTQRQA